MKNRNHYSLVAFIKNVMSTSKKVRQFVRNHLWKTVLLMGLISKSNVFITYGFMVPLYMYTDFFRDVKELLRELLHTKDKHLRRRDIFLRLKSNDFMPFLSNI